ncbi:MAG: gliding motility-associated peptidyl-prolyl isomerase GldI [Flavobacteriaceae bacterium]|nr:MAG: gliding motility-associated peptidyl-prolyl isomerase GldI [Flavobacteriaceae bacterium]
MKINSKIFFGILILFITLISCDDPIPRRPVSHHTTSYMQESVALNQQINTLEEKAILFYIAQDSLRKYKASKNGFWYSKINQNKNRKPIVGDEVLFEYEILDLSNQLIYSKEEIGQVSYSIDKENLTTGLQEGLKLMREGEEVKFIFPSFKAFGFTGDRQKIGVKQPLIYKVKLININK